jgi:hypothetical protein
MTVLRYLVQIGFLYLRYVADPKVLWMWYEPYLRDDEVHGTFPTFFRTAEYEPELNHLHLFNAGVLPRI